MKEINIDGNKITYTLTKSKRKSIAITIKPDLSISVKAPNYAAQKEIEAFLTQKSKWILKAIDRFSQREPIRIISIITGTELLLLGKTYTLFVNDIYLKKSNIIINEHKAEIALYTAPNTSEKAKRAVIESWYRAYTKKIITERAKYYAELLSVSFGDIRIKDQKNIWGSCSSKGNLNFNWRIIMAPKEVLDYLVVHELCHLRFMNHSSDFWQCVAGILPDYKNTRKWLKTNTDMLKKAF